MFIFLIHTMNECKKTGGTAPLILNPGNRKAWVVSVTLGHFTFGKRAPGTHWSWGWVGPRAGLGALEKKIKSCPGQDSNPGPPIIDILPGPIYVTSLILIITIISCSGCFHLQPRCQQFWLLPATVQRSTFLTCSSYGTTVSNSDWFLLRYHC
jgi:hypothetical protein